MQSGNAADGHTRRAVLGAVGVGLTSGCVRRTRGLANRNTPEQVALTVKTLPADVDRTATKIARTLTENLETVGIDSEISLLTEDELYRDVLLNHDFDVYVARTRPIGEPDTLRALLHSRFGGEPGWQNPFGYSDMTMDELLEKQRTVEDRQDVVFEIQRHIAREQPFTVLCHPDQINATRSDRFTGWSGFDPTEPLSYLQLEPTDGDVDTLHVTTTDERVTRNFNPLAVEFRNHERFLKLLYDPLSHPHDGELLPWLATSWEWDTDGETTVTINLRPTLRWHDGESLTADDVVFTYEFLANTASEEDEQRVPAPRYRGRVSLIEGIDQIDHSTVRFSFGDTTRDVARRALTVPILPTHEWEQRADPTNVAGIEVNEDVTEALVWQNPEPVGSGPLQFERSEVDDVVVLRRYPDHFLHRNSDGVGEWFEGGVPFAELRVHHAPTDETAIELVGDGTADATTTGMSPGTAPQIIENDDIDIRTAPTSTFYHVGYNTRKESLSNPYFRRAIARTLDKEQLRQEVFGGYGSASAVPLRDPKWLPEELRWRGTDPEVPFAGSDGELRIDDAREQFREAGYQYNQGGELLTR